MPTARRRSAPTSTASGRRPASAGPCSPQCATAGRAGSTLQASPLFKIDVAFDAAHMADLEAMRRGARLEAPRRRDLYGPALQEASKSSSLSPSARAGISTSTSTSPPTRPRARSASSPTRRSSAQFDGQILVGHCCSLRLQDDDETQRAIDEAARAGIAVVSLPMCNLFLQDRARGPHATMARRHRAARTRAAGVDAMIASDNMRDPFYAYGDIDMLEVWREGVRILHLDYPFARLGDAVRDAPARAMGLDLPAPRAGAPPISSSPTRATSPNSSPARRRDRIVLRNGLRRRRRARLFGTRRAEGLRAMTRAYDIAGFRALIGGIACEDNPILVRQKSRDFYWYSPVLKRELESVTADLVVSPKTEAEVARRPRRRATRSPFR